MADKSVRHQTIVENLLSSKAVDFDAIGRFVAQMGPSIAAADEPWEGFCGTMRTFIRLYRIPTVETPLENVSNLGKTAGKLGG